MPPSIVWRELANEALAFTASVGAVDVTIAAFHTRPAVRTGLTFRSGVEEFALYSPIPVGWFGKKYASQDDADLAERLQGLLQAAAHQCAQRNAQAYEHPEKIREQMYQKLLFEQPAKTLESCAGMR